MDLKYQESEEKPLPGWACAAVGIGFVVFLVAAIVGARVFGGG